jgi:hypothetical protein
VNGVAAAPQDSLIRREDDDKQPLESCHRSIAGS